MNISARLSCLAAALFLLSCAPQPQKSKYEELLSGEVLFIGKNRLSMKTPDSFVRVALAPEDQEKLKELKKGEKITLYGKKAEPVPKEKPKPSQKKSSKGKKSPREEEALPPKADPLNNAELYEIMRENGTLIHLAP